MLMLEAEDDKNFKYRNIDENSYFPFIKEKVVQSHLGSRPSSVIEILFFFFKSLQGTFLKKEAKATRMSTSRHKLYGISIWSSLVVMEPLLRLRRVGLWLLQNIFSFLQQHFRLINLYFQIGCLLELKVELPNPVDPRGLCPTGLHRPPQRLLPPLPRSTMVSSTPSYSRSPNTPWIIWVRDWSSTIYTNWAPRSS